MSTGHGQNRGIRNRAKAAEGSRARAERGRAGPSVRRGDGRGPDPGRAANPN